MEWKKDRIVMGIWNEWATLPPAVAQKSSAGGPRQKVRECRRPSAAILTSPK